MSVNIEEVKNRIHNSVATNKNDLYNSNIYWSQKPFNICDILIESFSKEGDIIYDPFLGSGVTLLESINSKYNRIGIGCEINSAPVFLVETLLKEYDTLKFDIIAKKFIKKLKELLVFYETECLECGSKGIITSVVFDKKTRYSEIEIKTINYRCTCSPKLHTKECNTEDLNKINVKHELKNITDDVLIADSKLAVYENQPISQIFTKRNFAVLDEIIGIINELEYYNDLFRYILMSILHLCKITDKHSNSQWPLWIPKTDCVEKNIIDIVEKKVKAFRKTIDYLNKNYNNSKRYKLFNKGSQYITNEDIEDGSVRLIITDPPYLGQVAYSEYMQLYKSFLNLDFNTEDEIVVSSAPSRSKNETDYFKLLENVFEICSNKLQNNGMFCMYFHDSNLDVWNKIIGILSKYHLKYLTQIHIPKSNTLKNIISPKKSLNGDCVLFFEKDENIIFEQSGKENVDEIESNIVRQAKFLVRRVGALSTPELYDNGLMEILIQNGWLDKISKKHKSLVDIFEKHLKWDSKISKWTI